MKSKFPWVYIVLLEHSHGHVCLYCLCFPSCCNGRAEQLGQRAHGPNHLLSGSLQKKFADLWFRHSFQKQLKAISRNVCKIWQKKIQVAYRATELDMKMKPNGAIKNKHQWRSWPQIYSSLLTGQCKKKDWISFIVQCSQDRNWPNWVRAIPVSNQEFVSRVLNRGHSWWNR